MTELWETCATVTGVSPPKEATEGYSPAAREVKTMEYCAPAREEIGSHDVQYLVQSSSLALVFVLVLMYVATGLGPIWIVYTFCPGPRGTSDIRRTNQK